MFEYSLKKRKTREERYDNGFDYGTTGPVITTIEYIIVLKEKEREI